MEISFKLWTSSLRDIVSREMGMSLDDVNVSEALMKRKWREGYSPLDFFNEFVIAPSHADALDDFDPKYDL